MTNEGYSIRGTLKPALVPRRPPRERAGLPRLLGGGEVTDGRRAHTCILTALDDVIGRLRKVGTKFVQLRVSP